MLSDALTAVKPLEMWFSNYKVVVAVIACQNSQNSIILISYNAVSNCMRCQHTSDTFGSDILVVAVAHTYTYFIATIAPGPSCV